MTISDITFDYTANTVEINGEAKSLDKVNQFVDTLKFTTYSNKDVTGEPAFSEVVLSQFTRSASTTTYTITTAFDPAIFDNTSEVNLKVPNKISTRSVIEQPTELFKKAVTDTNAPAEN